MNISFLKEKGNKFIIIGLLGLLVLVMCIPTEQNSGANNEQQSENLNREERLEQVLSVMEGVGAVKVMITTDSSTENLFASSSQEEKVCGVLVVAEGAGKPTVDAKILEAVKALFSIDVHKISIVKMRSQEDRK